MAHILVIDDDEFMLDVLGELLAQHGLEVETALGGTDGIASALARRPSLVVLDLNMQDMDGREVAKRLRGDRRTESIPLIAVTADRKMTSDEAAHAAGFDAYIAKPFDSTSLFSKVAALLAQ